MHYVAEWHRLSLQNSNELQSHVGFASYIDGK